MKSGVVFKVQLVAFEEIELPDGLDTSFNFDIEHQEEVNQYVIGQFRDYYKADLLKSELRNMGVERFDSTISKWRKGSVVRSVGYCHG
jgi:hypothetical protein